MLGDVFPTLGVAAELEAVRKPCVALYTHTLSVLRESAGVLPPDATAELLLDIVGGLGKVMAVYKSVLALVPHTSTTLVLP